MCSLSGERRCPCAAPISSARPTSPSEIASPNDTHPELAAKAAVYMQVGVRLLWIAWPTAHHRRRGVQRPRPELVRALTDVDTLDGLDVVPGFQCPVKDVFAL